MTDTPFSEGTIELVPVGPVGEELLAWLAERLTEQLDREVRVGDALSLPDRAYDPGRKQYRGGQILQALRGVPAPGAVRLLGLVEADCYAAGLNFILGQAGMHAREAFVALARLHPSFFGLPENQERFRERVLKEAVHELGHTWGLSHCPDPTCVMHFSNTLRDTDIKGVDFCPRCHEGL